MSQPSAKKRKQSSVVIDAGIPSKKSKREEKRVKKDKKGKPRDTQFHVVKTSLVLSIPPIFASNPRTGVEEMLDSMVMRYIPALQGVVLSHSNLGFLSKVASIQSDCPFLVCNVGFDATIWSPHVGMRLVGKINLCSPDHISLLVHRTFNVSIPRHHIPREEWDFEYGPAENDPEFGPDAPDEEAEENDREASDKQEGDAGGRWVHHLTNEKLGGEDGFLEFTVIGLTVANEMLSLLGSIQLDPFSPEHVPETGPPLKRKESESDIEDVEDEQDIESDEVESDEDTFKVLGDKAAAEAANAKREAEEAEAEAKEKKKRKTDSTGKADRKRKKS